MRSTDTRFVRRLFRHKNSHFCLWRRVSWCVPASCACIVGEPSSLLAVFLWLARTCNTRRKGQRRGRVSRMPPRAWLLLSTVAVVAAQRRRLWQAGGAEAPAPAPAPGVKQGSLGVVYVDTSSATGDPDAVCNDGAAGCGVVARDAIFCNRASTRARCSAAARRPPCAACCHSHSARCRNTGSPGAYYFSPAATGSDNPLSNVWLVYLEGGMWVRIALQRRFEQHASHVFFSC